MRMFRNLALGLAAVPVAALSHHGWSGYDANKPIRVTGALSEVQWGNPHGAAAVRYKGKSWHVVLAPVSRMEARGLTREMLGPKQRVTLIGYPRSDGTAEMRIERVKVGAQTIELR